MLKLTTYNADLDPLVLMI